MAGVFDMRAVLRLILAFLALLFAAPLPAAEDAAKQQAERQVTQPLNNKPFWEEVRKGTNPNQVTQIRGIETNVLVQTQGQFWRELRNGPITVYGGWLLVLVVAALGAFYLWRGKIRLSAPPTGRLVERFNGWERVVHWSVAISFVIMAASGLTMLFGKYVLLPMFGYTLFAWLASIGKALHNFVGPLFLVGAVLMFFMFVRDNIWQRGDLHWILTAGGLFTGKHVPSWRFNIAEKSWFWFGVTFLGIVVSATGLVLDFPNFAQGRETMQLANVIHASAAIAFLAAALGHIYLGTIGMEGAYDSMRHGTVDETWAKEHHEYWYDEVVAGRGHAGSGTPSAAAASSMKEGWKL